MFTKSRLSLVAFLAVVFTLIPVSATASVPKIEATPSSSSLAPAQSVSVNFQLDQPIICATNPCDVTLDFTNVLALGLTASVNSVTWAASDWAQTRTIIFTLDPNTSATHPQAVDLSIPAQSNAAYYSQYRVDLIVNLVVPDIRPTPVAAPAPEQLAVTGSPALNQMYVAIIAMSGGICLLLTGTILRINSRRKVLSKAH
jgi:hypothetical protein